MGERERDRVARQRGRHHKRKSVRQRRGTAEETWNSNREQWKTGSIMHKFSNLPKVILSTLYSVVFMFHVQVLNRFLCVEPIVSTIASIDCVSQ